GVADGGEDLVPGGDGEPEGDDGGHGPERPCHITHGPPPGGRSLRSLRSAGGAAGGTRPRVRHRSRSPTPDQPSRTPGTRPGPCRPRRPHGGSDGCSLLGPLVEGGVSGGETAGDQRLPVLAALRCDSGAVQPDPRPVVAVAALLVGGPVAVAGALVVDVVGFGFVPAGRPLVEDPAHRSASLIGATISPYTRSCSSALINDMNVPVSVTFT